jgi:ferredoxin
VHEEVRDFGMVVDPGCMKCMDCVSVCPKEALYLGVGTPAAFAQPRVEPPPGPVANRRWDLSWREEIAIAAVMLVFALGFRGMYQSVPLLMSMGLASIGAFGVFKCGRLLRDRNVRGPYWQLKRDGRLRPAGWAFALATLLYAALGVQGLIMNWSLNRAELQYAEVIVPREKFFDPQRVAPRVPLCRNR